MLHKLLYFLWAALVTCTYGQTVEGTVINSVTGAGIGGAKVTLQQGTLAYAATTDAAGHFLVEDVKDGAYSVRYDAERYFSPSRRTVLLQVRTGASAVRIEGRLLPFARVGGLVKDPSGRVVPDAVVELTTPQTFETARTDDKGRFSFDSVVPGAVSYTLQVEPPPGLKLPPANPDVRPRGWATTFYPGVSRREQAIPIALKPGSNLEGLEKSNCSPCPHTPSVECCSTGITLPRRTFLLCFGKPARAGVRPTMQNRRPMATSNLRT